MMNRTILKNIGLVLVWAQITCAMAQHDSLITAFENGMVGLSPEAQVDTLLKMSRKMDTPSSQAPITLALKAKEISKAHQYGIGVAKSYKVLGNAYVTKQLYTQALGCFKRGTEIYDSLGKREEGILCFIGLANAYTRLERYTASIKANLVALEIAESIASTLDIADIHNNIGVSLNYQQKYEQAKIYLERAVCFNPPDWLLISIQDNLAISLKHLGETEEAISYLQSNIKLCENQSDSYCDISAIVTLSSIYFDYQNYNKAITYGEKAIMKLNGQNGLSLISSYNNVGASYVKLGQPDKAIPYLKKGLQLIEERKINNHALHLNLSEAYEAIKADQQALYHLKQHVALMDTLHAFEKNREVAELLTQYETEKKAKKIRILKQEAKIKDLKVARQIQLQRAVIIGATLLVVFVMIILFAYREKNLQKEQLRIKNEELNRQKTLEVIRDYELNTIKASIEGQEKEKQRISSELHDGISGNLAGIKMMLSKIEERHQDDESIAAVIKKVDGTYREVRSITHQLTPPGIYSGSFCGLVQEFLNGVSSGNIAINFISHPKKALDQLKDEEKIEVYRIIQELMNNIIKHAKSDEVAVQLMVNEKNLNLMVEDNGVGFDTRSVSQGLGLANIHSRVTKMEGKIDIDSVVGRGTVVNIDFPIEQR